VTAQNNIAHHEYRSLDGTVTLSSDRTFGIVFFCFWGLVAFAPLLHSRPVRWWALAASLVCLLSALLIPKALHPFNRLWGGLARLLHRVISPVAMALTFYLVFTVVGVLLRAFGKDMLRLRAEPGADTYWIPRIPPGPQPDTMANQF
jgi:hypothetical protein